MRGTFKIQEVVKSKMAEGIYSMLKSDFSRIECRINLLLVMAKR